MHEAAIAQSIVKTILEQALQQEAQKIKSVEIEIGELTFLSQEQVEFWVKIGFKNTIAENAAIEFHIKKGVLKCKNCGYKGPLQIHEDPVYHMRLPAFSCPKCKNSNTEITEGREAIIRRIKILKK